MSSLNFRSDRTDWDHIKEELSDIDWNARADGRTAHEIYQNICEVLSEICPKYTPLRNLRRTKMVPRDRRILMQKRKRLFKRSPGAESIASREQIARKLAELERQLIESRQTEAMAEETKAVEAIRRNPKYFYAFARRKTMTKSSIGPFRHDGNIISDPYEKSEMLRRQYESAFSTPREPDVEGLLRELLSTEEEPDSMTSVCFTENDLADCIDELDAAAASGPDDIPALLLKRCKEQLKTPLLKLWKTSMDTGVIPDQMKLGMFSHAHPQGR